MIVDDPELLPNGWREAKSQLQVIVVHGIVAQQQRRRDDELVVMTARRYTVQIKAHDVAEEAADPGGKPACVAEGAAAGGESSSNGPQLARDRSVTAYRSLAGTGVTDFALRAGKNPVDEERPVVNAQFILAGHSGDAAVTVGRVVYEDPPISADAAGQVHR